MYSKILIIRGIGFRAKFVINDVEDKNNEFQFSKYLIIRAGHTTDLYVGIPPNINIKISKKDRKLVIFGRSKVAVMALYKKISNYREPSAYTGRGIRTKGTKPIRKAGKKDKQKGKSF
jgi:ribosomal protein L6P/L9E